MSSSPNQTASVYLDGLGNDICSPFFDSKGSTLHVVLQSSGDIMMVGSTIGAQKLHSTGGQPSSACYGSNGTLYISDYAHAGILSVDTQDGQQELMVGVYEDKPFKGPSSVVISSSQIYFTDSGPLGETGLHSPSGNVFVIIDSPSGQILKPIALGTLAYPSAIAVSNNGKFVYVAEMMTNRIIRYFQQPEGVYHGSVFVQLNGAVGPSCLAYDSKRGNLIVGMYETKDNNVEGVIYIISASSGKIVSTVSTKGPEISGLVVAGDFLYITEKSSGGTIYKAAL
jgi:sugar lactone lactonase YvrE